MYRTTDALAELEKDDDHSLRALCNTAVSDGTIDADENLNAIQNARQGRVQHIHDLLMNAVVGEDPPDDGIAEPGMVLTVRYDETGETETFLLGVPGAEAGDIEVYSMQSPLGTAIAGARAGQRTPILSPAARPCP